MTKPMEQSRYRAIAEAARTWWRDLQPEATDGGRPSRGDRAALARLRRAATPIDAVVEEETFALFRRLALGEADWERLPRVAIIAHVLAHVRSDAPPDARGRRQTLMRALGWKSPDPASAENALLKSLRFRGVLSVRDDEEIAREMRRLVALAGRENIDVGDLAASIFFWNDTVRTRWAFDYYDAGIAAPERADANAEASPAMA